VLALLGALLLVPLVALTTAATAATAVTTAPAASAADGSLFRALSGYRLSDSANVSVRPTQFRAYQADLAGIRASLAGGRPTTLSIPDPAGTPTDFTVAEDSVMAPALQAAHPDIRTYAGSAANGTTIRLDVTPFGFHAMVRQPDGVSWYVEPATRAVGEARVVSFAGAAAGDAPTLVEQEVRGAVKQAADRTVGTSFSTPGGLVTQRTYRLALVTDPTYAAFVAPGATTHAASDPLVLAAKTTLINRVDEVYNDDVGYKFTLIAGTDKLNLMNTAEMSGTSGPCGADACFPEATGSYTCLEVLDRNDFVLGQIVGADTYDIGHIGLGVNGGGIAGLGVVGDLDKGTGCTGIPTPVGDFYAIDYVAHELGHQMGGDHTFNGIEGACGGGNRNNPTAVEPGSGSSIMAYAGICDTDDLQPHSDPYFSFKSIDEFEATAARSGTALHEKQSVAMTGLANGEQLTISCPALDCTPTNVTFSGTGPTDKTAIATAIQTATRTTGVTVSDYDQQGLSSDPSTNGFTATWADSDDHPSITVTGPFTALVGTLVQGGPEGNGGNVQTVSTDHSPVVTAPADKTIPTQTPFTLTGSATDADADVLHYLWEQTDSGTGTDLVSNSKPNGPLFRVFGTAAQVSGPSSLLYHSPGENVAGTEPSRSFPDLSQILAGTTNAATGTCPAAGPVPVAPSIVDCYSEFLPTSARSMHFRLTVRDSHIGGGGVSWDDVALTVDPTAGPFLVTSRASGGVASGVERVTWAVANTNTAALAKNVKITLSTDGGLTYPVVLAASTPNDGSEAVLLPNISTSTARIKVEAVGNYFFDLNDANFSVVPAVHLAHGKGTFTSPKGSSTRFVGAQGKAKLAFLGEPGASPIGAATFTFTNGKIKFSGDTVVSSRIKRHTITMKVSGSNGHKAHYTLVITAVDKGSKDRVRVRLLRRTTLVYDSMPGTKASARPQTRVKGSITVT
jgi:hypothetical protein